MSLFFPLENIEIIQNINKNKNNLINIEIENLFKEYSNKNLALIFIEESDNQKRKYIYQTKYRGKNISKNLNNKR